MSLNINLTVETKDELHFLKHNVYSLLCLPKLDVRNFIFILIRYVRKLCILVEDV